LEELTFWDLSGFDPGELLPGIRLASNTSALVLRAGMV
jgi:hypothetical protein